MFTLLVFLVVLSLLVFVHELGHFYVAKKFGLTPKEFGFGFPPRLFGIYKNKEGKWKKVYGRKEVKDNSDTIYSINWIPLGGFVNIGEDEDESDSPNHFVNQKPWKRATILSAGVTMNVVLAAVLLSIGLMIGFPQSPSDNIDSRAKVSQSRIYIAEVLEGMPAQKAGFEKQDIVLKINGELIKSEQELRDFNNSNFEKGLVYEIERNGEIKEITVIPETIYESGEMGIGVQISEVVIVKYPWYLAIWEGTKTTFVLLWLIIVAFFEFFKGLLLGNGLSADLSGPFEIARMVGDSARAGLIYLIQLTALISLNLAIINFLPFPALDGGRVLFIIIEKIKRKPVPREIENTLHYIGFLLLMLLVSIVTYKELRDWIVERFVG